MQETAQGSIRRPLHYNHALQSQDRPRLKTRVSQFDDLTVWCLSAQVVVEAFAEQILHAARMKGGAKGFIWAEIEPSLFIENSLGSKGAILEQCCIMR